MNFSLHDLEAAARIVYADLPPTPQFRWPLLAERLGADIWVKHENHSPVGAFKLRGGLVYFSHLTKSPDRPNGVVTATRGNHGQSIGLGARRYGLPATIVVPHGNSREKNAAMRALGVELIEHGDDFQASVEYARGLASERSLHMVPSFHSLLVGGVATYGLELFRAVAEIDTLYVPIGMGSGACAMIAARDALGLSTKIVGVVSTEAPAYAKSFEARSVVEAPTSTRLADGMACRAPNPDALAVLLRGLTRIVRVTDDEVAAAMRLMFETTHNVVEGAGAAALAAATQERHLIAGRRIAVVATGGNVDSDVFAGVLAGRQG